ncbi:KamA family protein [Puteibacter caeruleilacunae]|nr:KamA family protein [Puteibacter caeruleilacunae]
MDTILRFATKPDQVNSKMKEWMLEYLDKNPYAQQFYSGEISGREGFEKLKWADLAAIRILDYIDHADNKYIDQNLRGATVTNNPFRLLWFAKHNGTGGAHCAFFEDMLNLFRQLNGRNKLELPEKSTIESWMERHPSGMDEDIMAVRRKNKDRIIRILINKFETGLIKSKRYHLNSELTFDEKYAKILKWWDTPQFHLRFAVKSPDLINEFLDYSLSKETMEIMFQAEEIGIPFFVNPYYLSLLNIDEPEGYVASDMAIRDYIFYTKELISEFGDIVAWEKEDIVEVGKPNAAGWILPTTDNLHRRYPEVAILIPDTVGRACGGLCSSCQRMYNFQSGILNFNLDQLRPDEKWDIKLQKLMTYFEEDTQLRDILLTGGDALMTSNPNLEKLFNAFLEMIERKREANKLRPEGEKYAEILRIRLGTRLPVYLPQRIDDHLISILSTFKEKASQLGVKQFIVQTHFESAMEITEEAKLGIERLLNAGWAVTNQLVFTSAASRRGHTAKLRKELNDIGIVPYYTFSVKGFMENSHNFATNARAVQEQMEEKVIGRIPAEKKHILKDLSSHADQLVSKLKELREEIDAPFLASDRNVLNLPGVGKSLTFRTIGITPQGRRILEFDHDHNRKHSPIINEMGKVVIIESKPIINYLKQLGDMGEDISEYDTIWGYSAGETEPRMGFYEYPDYDFELTEKITNFKIDCTEKEKH